MIDMPYLRSFAFQIVKQTTNKQQTTHCELDLFVYGKACSITLNWLAPRQGYPAKIMLSRPCQIIKITEILINLSWFEVHKEKAWKWHTKTACEIKKILKHGLSLAFSTR